MDYSIPPLVTITPWAVESVISNSHGLADTTLEISFLLNSTILINKAIFVPFEVYAPCTIVKMFVFNGGTAGGNWDAGIYDETGKRIVSSGSTAMVGTDDLQELDITDTVLAPGHYYMAIVNDNNTGGVYALNPDVEVTRGLGILHQESGAFPLPATATWIAAETPNLIYAVGVTTRSVV